MNPDGTPDDLVAANYYSALSSPAPMSTAPTSPAASLAPPPAPNMSAPYPADYYGPPPPPKEVSPLPPSDVIAKPPASAADPGLVDDFLLRQQVAQRERGFTVTGAPPKPPVSPAKSSTPAHFGGAPAGPAKPKEPSPTDRYRATFETEKGLNQQQADIEKQKADENAAGLAQIAAKRQEEAESQAREAEESGRIFRQHMDESQRQLDEVRAAKVDPNRLFADDGQKAVALIGGILGGIYQGLNKMASNPFLDDLNKSIDRDIALQERELSRKERAIEGRQNLLGQMRSVYKDEALARSQAKAMMLTSMQEQLNAQAASHDSPAIQARANQANNAIGRELAKLDIERQKQAQAAGAAAAALRERQQKEVRDSYTGFYEKALASGMSGAQAEAEAQRQIGVLYSGGGKPRAAASATGPGSDPIAAVPKDQKVAALKEQDEYSKAESTIGNIKGLFRKWDATGVTSPRQLDSIQSGIAGVYKTGLGPGMSSDNDFEQFIKPNMPRVGDSAETLALKQANIEASIRGKVATPILDHHAKGWKGPAPVQRFDLDRKPIS